MIDHRVMERARALASELPIGTAEVYDVLMAGASDEMVRLAAGMVAAGLAPRNAHTGQRASAADVYRVVLSASGARPAEYWRDAVRRVSAP